MAVKSDYAFPQLVRVQWKNLSTNRIRAFVPTRLAINDDDAEEIGGSVIHCMIPLTLYPLLLVRIQVTNKPRDVTMQDAKSDDNFVTLWRGNLHYKAAALLEAPKRKRRRA